MRNKITICAMVLMSLVLLTACESKVEKQEQTKNNPTTTNTDTPAKEQEELSVDDQLRLIASSGETWRLEYREEESPFLYEGSEQYDYTVCDLNQNGRLEIINTTTNGNGYIFYDEIYEVNETGDALVALPTKTGLGPIKKATVYYDKENEVYHYAIVDMDKGSAIYHEYRFQDIRLGQDKVMMSVYSACKIDDKKETYYAGNFKKKISKKKFENREEKHFAGMEKKQAEFKWFATLEEGDELYLEDASVEERLAVPTEEELYNRIKKCYETFRIY